MSAQSTNHARFYEIDLLRFLAAFAVVLYHYLYRGWIRDNMSDLRFEEIGWFFQYGHLGVDVFFIISGFVILMSACDRSPVEFAISRITRLYPAYWFGVTLTATLILLIGFGRFEVTAPQYAANMTMLHHFMGIDHIDGVYWSLVVELKFYLIIFVILLSRQLHRIAPILWLWLACAWLASAIQMGGAVAFFLVPRWAGYFIAGATFFLIARQGVSMSRLAMLTGSYLLVTAHLLRLFGDGPDYHSFVRATIISSFFVLFWAISRGWLTRLARPSFVAIGALTYPLYLLHENIGFMLFNLFADSVDRYILLTVVIGLMLWLSWWVNRRIENRYGKSLRALLQRGSQHVPGYLRHRVSLSR